MRKKTELKIRTSFLVLWLCSLTAFVYAIEPGMPNKNTGEDRLVRSVPVTESKSSEDGTLPSNSESSSSDSAAFLRSGSEAVTEIPRVGTPTLVPNGQVILHNGSAQDEPVSTLQKQPSEQEIGAMVDDILSRMADAGLREDLSRVLTYISGKDYAGLANFQKKHPEILNKLRDLLQEVSDKITTSAMSPEHSASKDYADRWLEEIKGIQEKLPSLQPGADNSDPLVEAVAKLYRPIAKRISEMAQSLEDASRASGDSGSKESSSGDVLKNFSDKAKKLILNSLNQAQSNLADGMLSNPIETTAFAAETPPAPMSEDAVGVREMTISELYVKGKQYRVVDSVYIGKDFIYAQKMLHPPANLHPYLKWLLYTRNLTPRMVEHYLATREAVGAIYEQAKAGQGNIRYKDKVYGAFLPFAVTAAGNYELVKSASAE